jgi:hypothetical protein
MSYDDAGLVCIANLIGAIGSSGGNAKKLYTYVTNDTKAVVEAAEYFNDEVSRLNVGDVIMVSGDIDGTPFGAWYVVSGNDGTDVTITEMLTGSDALAAEITRACDVSARNVNTTDDLTLTQALHEGRTVTVDKADGAALVLPAASVGDKYRIVLGTTVTSNSTTIKVANADDSFVGGLNGVDEDGEGATGYQWKADSGDDTITFDGTAQGGYAGDYVDIECIKANTFLVSGEIKQSGGLEATPFSATVS